MSLAADRALLMSEDFETVCEGAVKAIHAATDSYSTGMFLLSKRGHLVRIAGDGYVPETLVHEEYELSGTDLTAIAMRADSGSKYASARQFSYSGTSGSDQHLVSYLPNGAVKEILFLPLNGPNRTFGVIRCIAKVTNSAQPFPHHSLVDLTAFCHQVSISISNIRRKRELDVHDAIETLITSPFDLTDVFERTATMLIAGWTDFAACSMRTLDERGELQMLAIDAAPGVRLDIKRRSPRSPETGFPAQTLKTREPQVVRQVLSKLDQFADPDWIEANQFETAMIFPIASKEQDIGTLTVFIWFDLDLTRTKRRFVETVCKQLATATTMAGLVHARDQLIDRLYDLTAVQISWGRFGALPGLTAS